MAAWMVRSSGVRPRSKRAWASGCAVPRTGVRLASSMGPVIRLRKAVWVSPGAEKETIRRAFRKATRTLVGRIRPWSSGFYDSRGNSKLVARIDSKYSSKGCIPNRFPRKSLFTRTVILLLAFQLRRMTYTNARSNRYEAFGSNAGLQRAGHAANGRRARAGGPAQDRTALR